MRMQHRRLVLWVELRTDVPFERRNLYYLNQVALRVASHAHHAIALKLLLKVVVELITMTVTFLYVLLIIYIEHARALLQVTLVCAKTHGATHVGDVLLLLHDVNDIMWGLLVHFTAVGVLVSQHVPRELNDHHLHAKADAKGWYVVLTAIFRGNDLAFYATLSESRTNHDTILPFHLLGHVLRSEILRVDKRDDGLVVVVCPCLRDTGSWPVEDFP